MLIPGLCWVSKHPRVCVAAVGLLMLLLLIGGNRVASAQRSKTPHVIFLASTYQIPPEKPPIPDRWIPQSWGWLWRVKEAVLGKAKVVNLNVAAYELDSIVLGMQMNADPELGRLFNHADLASTNGQKVWLLPNSKIRELQKRFSGSAGSRFSVQVGITTADRCQARLMTMSDLANGGSRISQADVLPRVRASTTELTFILQSIMAAPVPLAPSDQAIGRKPKVLVWPSETNAVAALKLQLPYSTGFVVLDSQRKSSETVEAVLVTVDTLANNPAGAKPAAVVKRAK